MQKFFLLICCLVFSSAAHVYGGDPVYEYFARDAEGNILPEQNYYDVLQRFHERWGDKPGPKHSGWKQFKRWEYFWRGRINSDGSFPDVTAKRFEAWVHLRNEERRLYGGDQLAAVPGSWTSIGPKVTLPIERGFTWAGIGRVNVVSLHPTDPNQIWVASPTGGVWKSMDQGESWKPMTDDLPTLNFSDIAFDPNDPDVVYASSGDRSTHAWGFRSIHSLGLFKSVDGGETWDMTGLSWTSEEQAASGQYQMIFRVLVDPLNSDRVYVGTNRGVFRSTNGGDSFELVQAAEIWDMEFKPGTPRTIYAVGRTNNNTAGMFISRDAGDTWEQFGQFTAQRYIPQAAVAVTAADPDMVYAAVASNGFSQATVYRSMDSGENWEQRGISYGTGVWGFPLGVSQTNPEVVWVGDVRIMMSPDGGLSWGGTGNIHADQHYLVESPHDGYLYAGCDGGVYRSPNGGQTWTSLNRGLVISQFYRIAASTSDYDMIYAGAQDNGTMGFESDVQKWNHKTGADGMQPAVHPTNDSIVFTSWQNGGINMSTDRGRSFGRVSPDSLTGNGGWITPYVIDPKHPDSVYFGFRTIVRLSQRGTKWETLTPFLHGNVTMADLEICDADPAVQYVLTNSGRIFRTDDYWETWRRIDVGLTGSGVLLRIGADPNDPDVIWAVRGSYSDGPKVFRSGNAGSDWEPWHMNLPQAPVEAIIVQRDSELGSVYIGTELGVWYTDATLDEWLPLSKGMPAMLVRDFVIDYDTRRIRAASYGRGIWEMPLVEEDAVTPNAAFNLHYLDKPGCAQEILFRDHGVPYDAEHELTVEPMDGVTILPLTESGTNRRHSRLLFGRAGEYRVVLRVHDSNGDHSVEQIVNIETEGLVTPPLVYDFDHWFECQQGCNVVCELDQGWRNLPFGEDGDDNQWSVLSGPSEPGRPGIGPDNDHTRGDASGRYLAIQSNGCTERTAIVESPCLDLSRGTLPELRFAYHMNGQVASQMGSLHIDAVVGGNLVQDVIPPKTGNYGTEWIEESVDLSGLRDENVRLRFRGSAGTNNFSDIAIDDVSIVFKAAAPVAQFEADDYDACVGQEVALLNRSINPVETFSWSITPDTWHFVDGFTAESENPRVVFEAENAYTVALTVVNSEGEDRIEKADLISVIDVARPEIERLTDVLIGSSIEADEYEWFVNGEESDLEGQIVTVPNEPAVYSLRIRRGDCLSEMSEPYTFTVSTSVAEAENRHGWFRIDPNPHSGEFMLQGELFKDGPVRLIVADALGRTLMEQRLQASGGRLMQRIDIGDRPAGVYYVTVEVQGELLVLKTLKQ